MVSIDTIAVHAGERNTKRQNRPVAIPIEHTAAYYFENTRQIIDFYKGKIEGIKYGRYGCPTLHAAEEKIAKLEASDRALLFTSGMNAISTTAFALLEKGDHIIFTDDCYRNTKKFITQILPKYGIESTEIAVDCIGGLEETIKENTKVFFSELPTNPFLRVIDLAKTVSIAKKHGIISIIDSTFASPINIQPAKYGADLVLHSGTKYLGGHHDMFAGAIAGKKEIIQEIQEMRDIFGGILDPYNSYLLLRSLQTLHIRMKAHNENAQKIAEWLETQPKIRKVWYPSLLSHPDYAVAKKQLKGFGGVITFELKADRKQTSRFIDSLKIPYIATNFGGPQSLIEQHAILTFYNETEEQKVKRGIADNLVRFAVGFEGTEDIINDLKQALDKIRGK